MDAQHPLLSTCQHVNMGRGAYDTTGVPAVTGSVDSRPAHPHCRRPTLLNRCRCHAGCGWVDLRFAGVCVVSWLASRQNGMCGYLGRDEVKAGRKADRPQADHIEEDGRMDAWRRCSLRFCVVSILRSKQKNNEATWWLFWKCFATLLLMWSISSSSATGLDTSDRRPRQDKANTTYRVVHQRVKSVHQHNRERSKYAHQYASSSSGPGRDPARPRLESPGGPIGRGVLPGREPQKKSGAQAGSRNTAGQGVDVASGDWSQVPPCLVSREKLINKSKSVACSVSGNG